MTTVALRILLFTFFPLLLALMVVVIDRSATTRERRMETVLILMFAIGVAGTGLVAFFGHLFLSDTVADSIGWPRGNPFQLEMAFANLAIGLLGMVAVGRRDGFREATVLAATVLGVGATIVHLMDLAATGNLAPGNTIQNVGNLVKPVVLVWALAMARRSEPSAHSAVLPKQFDPWRAPLVGSSGPATAVLATGFGLGFAIGQEWLVSLIGMVTAAIFVIAAVARSPLHDVRLSRKPDRAS